MQVKVQVIENGVARDMFFDSNEHWMAVKFSEADRGVISDIRALPVNGVFITAPMADLKAGRVHAIKLWAGQWKARFFSGHRAPEGSLILPEGVKHQNDG